MSEFSWEGDVLLFMNQYHYVFATAAVLYYPVIFGLQYWLKDKDAFDLGGAKSQAIINWIFWWELGLAIFSMIGAYHVVPLALHSLNTSTSYTDAICVQSFIDHPASFWIFVFNVSKVVEFGDTLFVVLRKKKLILLQHYHHLATMLYCWWGVTVSYNLNNTAPYFAALNLTVHSVMYTWYAATRTGWRSPRILMMLITMLQLVQMIFGLSIVLIAQQDDPVCRWPLDDPFGAKACTFMYFSYLVLFAKLFKDNYCTQKPKKKSKKNKADGTDKQIKPE